MLEGLEDFFLLDIPKQQMHAQPYNMQVKILISHELPHMPYVQWLLYGNRVGLLHQEYVPIEILHPFSDQTVRL